MCRPRTSLNCRTASSISSSRTMSSTRLKPVMGMESVMTRAIVIAIAVRPLAWGSQGFGPVRDDDQVVPVVGGHAPSRPHTRYGGIGCSGGLACGPRRNVNASRTNLSEEDLGFRIELRWHQFDRRHCFRKRHEVDRGPMQRHHLPKVTVMKGVYGM